MTETLYTVEEAAQRLKMHPDTLRRHLRQGRIKSVRTGKLWRIPESVFSPIVENVDFSDLENADFTKLNNADFSELEKTDFSELKNADFSRLIDEANAMDLNALFTPPTPEEIAGRLAALETLGQGITVERSAQSDDPTAGVRQDREERAARLMEGHQ